MSGAIPHKIAKWPFLLADVILLGTAFYLIYFQTPAESLPHISLAVLCLLAGAAAGLAPFIIEFTRNSRLAEAAAVATVMSQIKGIETVAAQIRSATDNWQSVQEQSDKSAAAVKSIADRMTAEALAFGDLMQRINDNEKANLKLEVEKLKRIESDWIQVLVRTMDHVYALHKGALRSGQQALIEQVTNFQNACREAARRVGFTPFLPSQGDAYDPARHQLLNGESGSKADGVIEEIIATGYTFQGRLLRPALVRLRGEAVTPAPQAPGSPQAQLGL